MKFLCVPCDSPMKLQTVAPPEGGSLSVVYSCPECGYEMAMLTNPYETQLVQSLGVRIGPRRAGVPASSAASASVGESTSSGKCPFPAMMPGAERAVEARHDVQAGEPDSSPLDVRRRSSAREHSRVRPPHGADRHREIRPGARGARSGREDPRRGARLLRHVATMSCNSDSALQHRHEARDRSLRSAACPYVVSWNLTYRCNLACEHCYLDAGGTPLVGTENFADRSELGTEECFRVIDEIAAFAPECVTILTGGEPLLRRDILEIVRRASERGLWVVVGTNGVRITENVARRLAEAGARGLSLSLDALDPDRHDRFRKVRGAWQNTVEGAEILNRTGLPFIVQTTAGSHNLGELEAIADFAHDRLAAKVWNLYFLVPTGRGQFVSDITPAQYDEVLASLYRIQRKYDRRMLVNAKCAPHYIKTVLETWRAARSDPDGAESESAAPSPASSSGPTPEGPADALRARTTWGYGRTAMSRPAPTSRSSRGPFAARVSRTSGRPRSCSPIFAAAPSLGGRCGECEMNGHCGGCRARAYGMTGDLMAEDPLCTHTPGTFAGSPLASR